MTLKTRHRLATPRDVALKLKKRRLHGSSTEPINFATGLGVVVMMTGVVCKISKRGTAILLRHRSARVWIHFCNLDLPECAAYGERITVIGNLKTYNVGTAYSIVNGCILRHSPSSMIAAALKELKDAIVVPK